MSEHNNLGKMFASQAAFQALYADYLERGFDKFLDPNDSENVFDQDWKYLHYYDVGADAVRLCVGALTHNMRGVPRTILDLPSGHGRVTRHLKAFFPEARIVACDLYDERWGFCVKQFGVEGKKSTEHFDDLDFARKFDLIFCGSLLTHLPEKDYHAAMRCMERSLTEQGIAVITLQGRHAEYVQAHKYNFIEPDRFRIAMKTVPKTGFGYVDYNKHWLSTIWTEQARYGVAMVRPRFAAGHIEKNYGLRLLGYIERAWDNSQDAIIVGKPGVDEEMPT